MSVEMVIAVHPPFAWLVEWSALTARGERWFLITNDESKQRLASEGRLSCFAEVSTPSAFTLEALEALIEPWLTVAPERVRLATMIEPMQLVVAQLRERFGIPGPGVAALLPFTNKLAMKAAMNGVERYLPKYLVHQPEAFAADPKGYVASVVRRLGLPVFAKPIAENSSIGTGKLDTEQALLAFLESSPYEHELELDEFVEGDGYHIDAIVLGGKVVWLGAGRYLAPQGRTLTGAPLAGISITPRDALYPELERLHTELLGSFSSVPDGCTHMEVLRRPDGSWRFLEVAARVVGARCAEMHQLSRGPDLRKIHYQIQAEQPIDLPEKYGPHAGYYCPMKTTPGRIASVNHPPFRSHHTVEWSARWLEREDTATTMSMADCLGVFILWNDERSVLESDLEQLTDFRPYELVE